MKIKSITAANCAAAIALSILISGCATVNSPDENDCGDSNAPLFMIDDQASNGIALAMLITAPVDAPAIEAQSPAATVARSPAAFHLGAGDALGCDIFANYVRCARLGM
jgi:hypothetical protein